MNNRDHKLKGRDDDLGDGDCLEVEGEVEGEEVEMDATLSMDNVFSIFHR